jgi:hypothetical protein
MKMRSTSAALGLLVVFGLLIGRFLWAAIPGGQSVAIDYSAEVPGANGKYQFNIPIEPVMFPLQTIQGKYRLVRLRISNSTTTTLALSADRDRFEVLLDKGATAVAAVLNPQRLDPTFWGAIDVKTRENLAYPITLKGKPESMPGLPTSESLYMYVLVPAAQVSKLPEGFRYTIASLSQTIEIRLPPTTRGATAQ